MLGKISSAWEFRGREVMEVDFEEMTERRINDHALRIRVLEVKDASQDGKIELLCEKLDNLSKQISAWLSFMKQAIWKGLGVMGTIILIFLGFFIWYVQSLAR